MKKLIALLVLIAQTAGSTDWMLVWDHPWWPGDRVAGFKVWSVGKTNDVLLATVTNNTWKIDLPPGEYTLAVSAFNATGFDSLRASIPFAVVPVVIRLRIEQQP